MSSSPWAPPDGRGPNGVHQMGEHQGGADPAGADQTGADQVGPMGIAARIVRAPRPVLLACDVDGTLAPIAPTPPEAALEPGAKEVLSSLAARGFAVAIVSGRTRDELVNHFGLPPHLHLVGSHGAELGRGARPDGREAAVVEHVTNELVRLAALHEGARVEAKPFAAALHVRACAPEVAAEAILAVRRLFAWDERVRLLGGHAVVEVAASTSSKSLAVARLREQLRPASVAFVGDDLADEAVFATLREPDIGIKVGDGDTAASARLASPAEVVAMLRALSEMV